jgi:hypothetical protein
MNNMQVAHLWANQSKQSAKGSNFYFEGPALYSYGPHFCVAKIKEIDGARVALFNPRRYSQSTGRHQAYASRAAVHLECHSIDQSRWVDITDRASLAAAIEAQAKENAESEEAAKAAKREAARRKREDAKAEKMALSVYPEKLEAWRNGGTLPPLAHRFPIALRLCGKYVETSRGAKVPAVSARRVWPLLSAAASGADIQNGVIFENREFKWGDYTGAFLCAESGAVFLRVGCHSIPFVELEKMALCLNLSQAGKGAA